jgi:hypothetical protein
MLIRRDRPLGSRRVFVDADILGRNLFVWCQAVRGLGGKAFVQLLRDAEIDGPGAAFQFGGEFLLSRIFRCRCVERVTVGKQLVLSLLPLRVSGHGFGDSLHLFGRELVPDNAADFVYAVLDRH